MTFTQTEKLLSEITDEGLFEKLAVAILREAEYNYRTFVHTGANVDGKTIKSPVDGIMYRSSSTPIHLYVAHHTISAQKTLKKKWLNNPTANQPGKRRAPKGATEAGDLVKAIALIEEERKTISGLDATVVLTSNQEPDVGTVRDTMAIGVAASVEVDIWSRSRLAHFLDNNPNGNWLRLKYLGRDAELLSNELLLELSTRNLDQNAPRDLSSAWVDRDFDRDVSSGSLRPVTFIVAPSGFGKSIAGYRWVCGHRERGYAGFILSDDNIANSSSLADALDATLRQVCPSLQPRAGVAALSLCSPEHPIFLVVEDVSRSGQGPQLVERIEGWGRGKLGNTTIPPAYRIVCPIWPELLAVIGDEARKSIEETALYGAPFSETEGREAIQRRAALNGGKISNILADEISSALGHDPLLISLHDPLDKADPNIVITKYISDGFARVAQNQRDHVSSDYRLACDKLLIGILRTRDLSPVWSEVRGWAHVSTVDLQCLAHLIHDGKLIGLAAEGDDQRIRFRHDRVRTQLLINATNLLAVGSKLDDEIQREPFWAEIIGAVISREEVKENFLSDVRERNPLALFFALQHLPQNAKYYLSVVREIEAWLSAPLSLGEGNRYLRYEALDVLSHTENPDVNRITAGFKAFGSAVWQARFRNGDVGAGIQLCEVIEPGSTAPWRDAQIDHVKLRFGTKLVEKLDELLKSSAIESHARKGLLRLTGHVGDPRLGEAISTCWTLDTDRVIRLADYLWAAAECCGDNPEKHLDPVCEEWSRLPEEDEHGHTTTRNSLAANQVRWAFRRSVPAAAIKYFVKRGIAEDLKWPITYMLHEIDDPAAIDFVVHQIAELTRRAATAGSFSPFSSQVPQAWRRRQEEGGAPMSEKTRSNLMEIWTATETEKHLRRAAFNLWAATQTPTDISVLNSIDDSLGLADSILHQRLLRSDLSACLIFLESLPLAKILRFGGLMPNLFYEARLSLS